MKVIKLSTLFLGLILLFFSPIVVKSVSAQVVINEVFPNPVGEESGSEWVELYNLGADPYSLSGCTLYLDNDYDPQKVVFGEEAFIEKYKVITWGGFWLRNTGDQIRLICASFSDIVSYGDASNASVVAPEESFTFGRSPDGTGNYYLLSSVTLGEANSTVITPSPTPLPTAIPQPTGTPTPTQTPTPKPTATSTPKRTSTPKPTNIPSSEEEGGTGNKTDELRAEVLSLKEEGSGGSGKNDGKYKLPIIPIILIVLGAGLLGFSGFIFLKQGTKAYNLDSEKG